MLLVQYIFRLSFKRDIEFGNTLRNFVKKKIFGATCVYVK